MSSVEDRWHQNWADASPTEYFTERTHLREPLWNWKSKMNFDRPDRYRDSHRNASIWKCQTSQSTHSCTLRAQIMTRLSSSLIPVTRWFSWTGYLGNSRVLGRWRCWLSQSTPTRQFLLLREPCCSCKNTKKGLKSTSIQKIRAL